MKNIRLFEQFVKDLFEKKGDTYNSSCAMLYFDFPQLKAIHGKIDEKDLYTEEEDRTFGLEDEPHCTLLYGLEDTVTPDQIEQIAKGIKFGKLRLYNMSLFENGKYDVLKFDVGYTNKSDSFLHDCNEELTKLPYKSDFPDYHPHMTVAYLKPGMGDKYVMAFKNEEHEVYPNHIIFSEPDNTKTQITIDTVLPQDKARMESVVIETGTDDMHYKNIMAYYDSDGKDTKEKVAICVTGKPGATRQQIIDTLKDSSWEEVVEYEDDLKSQIKN